MVDMWIRLGPVVVVVIVCIWALCGIEKQKKKVAESIKKLDEAREEIIDLIRRAKRL